jgi:hypothetical protein
MERPFFANSYNAAETNVLICKEKVLEFARPFPSISFPLDWISPLYLRDVNRRKILEWLFKSTFK